VITSGALSCYVSDKPASIDMNKHRYDQAIPSRKRFEHWRREHIVVKWCKRLHPVGRAHSRLALINTLGELTRDSKVAQLD
jgi:hypothetical protein